MNKRLLLIALFIIFAGILVARFYAEAPVPTASVPHQVATASFACSAGKTIDATFFESTTTPPASPDQPPTPGGSVALKLSDGRTVTLPQTISADGGRYADKAETFIFWTKGDGAFIQENQHETYSDCTVVHIAATYKDATYLIDEQNVTLVGGHAEMQLDPTSSSATVTQYFGNDAVGDLNGDGQPDIVFILTQSTGGTGTFYYVVAALKMGGGYQGTNAVFLGDRIAPQATQIQDGKIVVNYADRKPGEPMTTKPSVGVSKNLKLEGTELAEVPKGGALGEHCGGNIQHTPVCDSGLHCAPSPDSHLPFGDVGGTCVAD